MKEYMQKSNPTPLREYVLSCADFFQPKDIEELLNLLEEHCGKNNVEMALNTKLSAYVTMIKINFKIIESKLKPLMASLQENQFNSIEILDVRNRKTFHINPSSED